MNYPLATLAILSILAPCAAADTLGEQVAGWLTVDGHSQNTGSTEYFPIYGSSSGRMAETDVLAVSPGNYTLTRITLSTFDAACGDLDTGNAEVLTVQLRLNQVNQASVSCDGDSPVGHRESINTSIPVTYGDSLSFGATLDGTIPLLGTSPRFSITLFATHEVSTMEITTAVDAWIPTVIWGTVILFFLTRRTPDGQPNPAFLPAVAAMLALMSSLLGTGAVSMTGGVALVFVALAVHVFGWWLRARGAEANAARGRTQ